MASNTARSGDRPEKESAAAQAIRLNNIAVGLARVSPNQEAVDQFRRATEMDPNFAVAFLNLSVVYDHMNRTAEALAAARHALMLDPENKNARKQVCEMSVFSKLVAEAKSCYEEMQKAGPLDEGSMQNYVLLLLKLGNLAAADPLIRDALQRMPSDPALLNGLGLLRYKQKRFEEAAAAFKQATEIDPEMGEARFNLALAQMAKSNRAAALSQYRLLEESNPKLAGDLYKLLYMNQIIYVGGKDK